MMTRISSALIFMGVFVSTVSVFGQRHRSRGIEILNASYSSHSRSCDATYTVARSCDNAQSCTITASNNLCGDPHFRVKKVLYVEYSCYGQRYNISIPENHSQEIDCGNNHNYRDIYVEQATYGTRRNWCDATYTVANQCDGQSSCDVYSSNNLCGDPEFRVVKDLEITYYCGRTKRVASARENSYARLSCY